VALSLSLTGSPIHPPPLGALRTFGTCRTYNLEQTS
jgi:hypothetical protein